MRADENSYSLIWYMLNARYSQAIRGWEKHYSLVYLVPTRALAVVVYISKGMFS